ncbi:hypothetical protein SY94_5077 (plasmid) [Agrobacterium tumefaciens]|nr:hypothetical protein SY94_5077 [Agrobacterium tumefaciens]
MSNERPTLVASPELLDLSMTPPSLLFSVTVTPFSPFARRISCKASAPQKLAGKF